MNRLFVQAVVCIACFSFSIICVNAQQFKWVRGGGTSQTITIGSTPGATIVEGTYYMCTDPDGNIYALNNVGTNPIISDTFHRASGAYGAPSNMLITSYNCSGQMRWAKLIGSNNGVTPNGIAADNLGNVYVVGSYIHLGGDHTLYIGYDTTISNVPSEYLATGIMQLDTNGHFNWVRFVGTNTVSSLSGTGAGPIATDVSNKVHYFCYVRSGVVLTPSVTSAYGVYDMTYNTAGTLLSAVRLDLDSQWFLHGAVIDPITNKLYVYGEVNTSGGATDTFFAAAFDASRNLLWQYFCGHGDDDGITGVVLDQNKNLYFCGTAQGVSGPPTFSFHGDSVSGSGDISIVMRTDTNGNVKWIKHFNSTTAINGFTGITLLANGKVGAVGGFAGTVTDGTVTISGAGNPYFVIFDSTGVLQTIKEIYGDEGGVAVAVTSDKVGNMYIGGQVGDSIWAGTPPISAYYSVGGNSDFFVMKYGVDCSCTAAPTASYTDTGSHTLGVAYTGTMSGLDSVVWSFGDGNTTTGTTAIHTYTASGTYHVCVTVYTNCGSDTHCSDVTIHVPSETAIILSNGAVKVFPNPANNALNITGVPQNRRYRIWNVTGSCMIQGPLQQGDNSISLKNLAPGVYILELTGEKGVRNMIRVVKE